MQKYNHQKVITQFLKAIELCPMDKELKMVLRLRIWGKNPKIFDPQTCQEIAIRTKTKTKIIEAFEEEAKYYLFEYLKKHPIADIEGVFSAVDSKRKYQTSLLDAHGTPLKI